MYQNPGQSIAVSLNPATRNANTNGTSVDLQGKGSCVVVFLTGTVTDGTHTPAVQESDDNSSFTAVAAGDLAGTALVAMTSNSVQVIAYKGGKRFVRAQCNSSGATGAVYGASILTQNNQG